MLTSIDPDHLVVFRSQQIWINTVCKGRVYPGSAGQGLKYQSGGYREMIVVVK